MQYNKPASGTPSTIGTQINTQYYEKKALIDLVKQQYFTPLADVTSMPKNFGKKIVRYHYLPLLDDGNVNDQGIDAAGATIVQGTYSIRYPALVLSVANANKATVAAAIQDNTTGMTATAGANDSGGTGLATITLSALQATYANATKRDAALATNVGAVAIALGGNLYGSSKDVGTISGKLPALSEAGGRVNRVGFHRVQIEGTFEKFGFFDDYTADSLNFDTDADLLMHINREMLRGANEITEDALQIDLLNSAGVVRYAGGAISTVGLGESNVVTYSDLMHLSIDLDNNRCPKSTTVITGTRLVDTKTLPACRVAFIGSELLPTFKAMKDLHNNPAFISVEKYSAGGTVLNGEVGAVDQWRLVVVPEMMKWSGAGADASASATSYETAQRYDVFPILAVGDESFTTIGFQTDGKSVKFKITHKAPGDESADRNDPYGETGFMSIKWFYGFMALRPERIAVIKTVARL